MSKMTKKELIEEHGSHEYTFVDHVHQIHGIDIDDYNTDTWGDVIEEYALEYIECVEND